VKRLFAVLVVALMSFAGSDVFAETPPDVDCDGASSYTKKTFAAALSKAAADDFASAFELLIDYRVNCGESSHLSDAEAKVVKKSLSTLSRRKRAHECYWRCWPNNSLANVCARCHDIWTPDCMSGACTKGKKRCSKQCGCRQTDELGECAILDYVAVCPICGKKFHFRVFNANQSGQAERRSCGHMVGVLIEDGAIKEVVASKDQW